MPAKLAPIPMDTGMLNMAYRDPNIAAEVMLSVQMPSHPETKYGGVAALYPLLLRESETKVSPNV